MRKEILFGIASLLVTFAAMAIVSAGDVELEIITYANHEVSVTVINQQLSEVIHYLSENSGLNGKASFNFSVSLSKVDISVIVRKNGKIVVYKKFEDISPVGSISLRVLNEEDAAENTSTTQITASATQDTEKNNTQTEEINQTEEQEETTNVSQITENEALVTEHEEIKIPESSAPITRIILYIISTIFIAFIILGLILFLVFRKKVVPKNIKITKYSKLKKEAEENAVPKTEEEKKLQELESKIKKLQGEIYDIRNRKTKIREAEEKIKADMEELERLKNAGR